MLLRRGAQAVVVLLVIILAFVALYDSKRPNWMIGGAANMSATEAKFSCPIVDEVAQRYSFPEVSIDAEVLSKQVRVPRFLSYDCDVSAFLSALFRKVTVSAQGDELRAGMLWIEYLQRTLRNACFTPVDFDNQAIYHPIWLLMHRYMNCGQVARLAVDGFSSVGIPARVLQMNNHVSAEFYAKGKGRLAEADMLTAGEFVLGVDGMPASVDEIVRDSRSNIKNVSPLIESEVVAMCKERQPHTYGGLELSRERREAKWISVFIETKFPQSPLLTPYVIKKVAALPDLLNHYYGWNLYEFCARNDPTCHN